MMPGSVIHAIRRTLEDPHRPHWKTSLENTRQIRSRQQSLLISGRGTWGPQEQGWLAVCSGGTTTWGRSLALGEFAAGEPGA